MSTLLIMLIFSTEDLASCYRTDHKYWSNAQFVMQLPTLQSNIECVTIIQQRITLIMKYHARLKLSAYSDKVLSNTILFSPSTEDAQKYNSHNWVKQNATINWSKEITLIELRIMHIISQHEDVEKQCVTHNNNKILFY